MSTDILYSTRTSASFGMIAAKGTGMWLWRRCSITQVCWLCRCPVYHRRSSAHGVCVRRPRASKNLVEGECPPFIRVLRSCRPNAPLTCRVGAMFNLVYKPCEYSEHRLATNCLPWLATPTLSTTMQSWFRKPECLSSWGEWHSKHPKENTWTWTEFIDNKDAIQTLGWDLLTQDAAAKTWGCCGMCAIAAGNVDVFYWPVSGANSECLKTIGTSIRPVDEGFFTYDLRGHKEFKSKPDPWATDKPLPAGNNPSHQMVRRFREILPTHNNSTATNGSAVSNHTIVGSTQVVSGYTLYAPPPQSKTCFANKSIAPPLPYMLGSVMLWQAIDVAP